MEKKKKLLLRDAFDACDADGSLSISPEELESIFKKLGKSISSKNLQKIMTLLDKDGNGSIEWDEFRSAFVNSNSQLPSELELFLNFGMFENLNITGYLMKIGGESNKWTNKLKKNWQKRYFVFNTKKKIVNYYSNEFAPARNSPPNGTINLSDFVSVKETQVYKKGD